MKLPVRHLIFTLWLTAGRLVAQLAGPSPLVDDQVTAQAAPGGWIVAERRAGQALQTGFPATAAIIYRELLRDPALPVESRHRVTLSLATALMDGGELAAAEKTLQGYDGPRNTAYQLRAGLMAAQTNPRAPQVKAALAAGRIEELAPEDKGWWLFLQGLVADAENDIARREKAYEEADRTAVSELQRSRFQLGQEQARMRIDVPSEAQLATYKGNMERYAGQSTGYDYARTYAAALDKLGRKNEALAVLQRQLMGLTPTQRNLADEFRLALGLVAGLDSPTGRRALSELLARGLAPERQRLALLLLDRGAKNKAGRDQLRRDLTELIGAPTQHPIIEDLMLVRATAALADKEYARAEEDARALLERYPGSATKAGALGVRLAVAWDGKRYRTAADVIVQLRAVLGEGRERAELGVLLAEAFFRSEDYKNSADAYAAAVHELPAVVPAGTLIFQRVLSDIRADQLDSAAKQLDEAAGTTGFDAESRWQAEWNLVKVMQLRPELTTAAQARVDRLLAGGAQGVPEELRIRLMWLRAKLSFDNDNFAESLRQTDELLDLLQMSGQLSAALRTSVTSMAQLLKAQALLALNRDKEGLAMLDKLRTDHSATPAAQYSHLVQAGFLTQRGDMAGAQGVLIRFVDNGNYQQSEYAPLALYEAALNLERQGLDRQLQEANKLLERLITTYPADELVFYARLKQGDLLRKLNDFANARLVYEYLLNNYAGHPDELLAQLALGDSLFAQGTNSVANYESAAAIFERLRDLPTAPVDLRVEAGFKWGAVAKRTQPAKAVAVYWSVVNDFLLDRGLAARLGAKGRYWVSRALLELGQLHEEAGRLDEAQRAYQLIVDNKLSGAAQAQAKLTRFRADPGAKP